MENRADFGAYKVWYLYICRCSYDIYNAYIYSGTNQAVI